jgi:hypothetical protein
MNCAEFIGLHGRSVLTDCFNEINGIFASGPVVDLLKSATISLIWQAEYWSDRRDIIPHRTFSAGFVIQ